MYVYTYEYLYIYIHIYIYIFIYVHAANAIVIAVATNMAQVATSLISLAPCISLRLAAAVGPGAVRRESRLKWPRYMKTTRNFMQICSSNKTIWGNCIVYLPDLLICIGFGTAMRFKTHQRKVDVVDFLLSTLSWTCVTNTTGIKQDHLLHIAY